MTFQDILDQLQELTPEQLQQEVKFVKLGASSDYDWNGLAEDALFEDSQRLRFDVADEDGVWYIDDEYSDGITNELSLSEIKEYGDAAELIIPANMPYFAIEE
ncbi:MAG: hypothetical protein IJ920_00750 [Paludibacteraceae bacterium]|nr:hypothetical protein [Paludibacteraceae bacterium]